MAALAYLLPPLSGIIAFLVSSSERTRWHGLQSIELGAVWPLALYVGALFSPGVTQAIFLAGCATWLFMLGATLAGRDPRLPGGRWLRLAARSRPGASPDIE
jgi:uncharacterized membrane protein